MRQNREYRTENRDCDQTDSERGIDRDIPTHKEADGYTEKNRDRDRKREGINDGVERNNEGWR